jgi:hypothetical protein
MPSAFDYREMARECMKEADASTEDVRKTTLESIAKLYVQTAFSMEQSYQDNHPSPLIWAVQR